MTVIVLFCKRNTNSLCQKANVNSLEYEICVLKNIFDYVQLIEDICFSKPKSVF